MLSLCLSFTHSNDVRNAKRFPSRPRRCSYDFLEIIDSHPSEYSRNREFNGTQNDLRSTESPNRTLENALIDATRNRNNGSDEGTKFDVFENFLNIYKSHRSHIIQTPDNTLSFERQANSANVAVPRRICGDWNSKVKLLRYRSNGPILGLHFSSDYSHHFGGYKAKVVIKDGE